MSFSFKLGKPDSLSRSECANNLDQAALQKCEFIADWHAKVSAGFLLGTVCGLRRRKFKQSILVVVHALLSCISLSVLGQRNAGLRSRSCRRVRACRPGC